MTGFTPEEWRTAARVARRSIFTEGNPDLADAWDKAADQVEARLIPAGGMALTAERLAELIKHAPAPNDGDYNDGYVAALTDLRDVLFPATEPAEEVKPDKFRKMTAKYATANFGFPDVTDPFTRWAYKDSDGDKWAWNGDQWELHIVPPSPAEPAEEETKAEYPRTDGDFTVLGPEIFTDASGEFICWKGVNYVRQPDPASSPVVPAPTETGPQTLEGPWDRIEDIPKTVGRVTDRDGDAWEWDGDNWVTPETAILPTTYINRKYAPFVAAEEG